MAQRKVNSSEDLHCYADDDEAGEIKDGSKRGRHRRKRTQKWHETFYLSNALTCSPRGCGTTAACSLIKYA